MSKKAAGKESLPRDLTAFEKLTIQLSENTQRQITDLTRQTREMAKEFKEFAEKSIEIHNELLNVTKDTKRIDENMQKQGQRQAEYEKHTNETLKEHAEQFGVMDKAYSPIVSAYGNIRKIIWSVVGSVAVAASIVFFVGKQ